MSVYTSKKQDAILLSSRRYFQLVNNTLSSVLLGYWPLWEAAGTTAVDRSGNGRDITYSAANITYGQTGIGDGRTCPLFAASSRINLYSASLAAAFSGAEHFISFWVKVPAAMWSDGADHYLLNLNMDANNYIGIYKDTNNNRIIFTQSAGGTYTDFIYNTTRTDWFNICMVRSESGGFWKIYVNGWLLATKTTIGTWAGSLGETNAILAAYNAAGALAFTGNIAHLMIGSAITETQLRTIVEPYGKPTGGLMISYDDGYASVVSIAYPYCSARSVKGTAYLTTGIVGNPGRLTWAQAQAMNTGGWDMGNHSIDGTDLSGLDQATIQSNLTTAQAALEAQGLTRASKHVAYPSGGFNATVGAAMTATEMLTGRNVTGAAFLPSTVDLQQIPTYYTDNTSTLATIRAQVEPALADNQYAGVLFHDVNASGNISTANFQALIDWIVANGIATFTISEIYALA